MSMQTKTIGRMPTDHGPYDPQLAYGKKFQCTLFDCAWESLHDNNNTAPAVWDGGDVITPNLVDWKKVSGSYEAWLMNNDKPASTGTTGAYPYNGMGRVVLKKHIVDGVNTLTHEAFEDSEGNDRGNTIYVIQYDFTLGEDITVPANCVLEFDGGSISGAYTLTGNNTKIESAPIGIFGSNISFAGRFNTLKLEWFGIVGTNPNNTTLFNSIKSRIDIATIKSFEFVSDITFSENDIILPRRMWLDGHGNRLIFTSTTGTACIFVSERNTLSDIIFDVNSQFDGAVIEDNTSVRSGSYHVSQLRLYKIYIYGTYRSDQDYKLTGLRFVCTNNHDRGGDGMNYITGTYAANVVILWVKTGIDIKLENVDVSGGAYAWMNDFCFNYAYLNVCDHGVIIDNRDSSTQNHASSSGLVCFGDLYIQPSKANKKQLVMIYNSEVNIKNLWPWDVDCIGELRNNTQLTLNYIERPFINQGSVTESGETCSFLSGFKIYDTSRIYHNEVFSNPIKWDNYNPASGAQVTRIKASSTSVGVVQSNVAIPIGVCANSIAKTHAFVMPIGGNANELFEDKIARKNGISIIGQNDDNYRIANQWLGHSWDGVAQCFAGVRNTREFNIRISSANYTSNACNKVTYTPYIDVNKTTPLLSKLSFQRVVGVMSANENIAKIIGVEVSGNSIVIYIETKQLSSTQIPVRFYLEFDDNITYTKKPMVNDIDIQIQDELIYMPAAADSSIEIAYRTVASYTSKPATPPYVGFMYFATNLDKPIYWTGDTTKGDNGWVDANGNNPSQS